MSFQFLFRFANYEESVPCVAEGVANSAEETAFSGARSPQQMALSLQSIRPELMFAVAYHAPDYDATF
jgi:hypothetical protein